MMKNLVLGIILSTSLINVTFAGEGSTAAAQPTACIGAEFRSMGMMYWKSVQLVLTNYCSTDIDFQNSTIIFKTKTPINTDFWGDFTPLSYPDNALVITTDQLAMGSYVASLQLHFPSYPGSNSKLPQGHSFAIKYGVMSDNHVDGSVAVYLALQPQVGNIIIKNNATKPTNIAQNYSLVHLSMNGQNIKDLQVPFGGLAVANNLIPGTYLVSPENITSGNEIYQGSANPSTIVLAANQTIVSNLNYALAQDLGKVAIKLQDLPSELTGYTDNPLALLTKTSTGTSTSKALPWGETTTVSQLTQGSSYQFSTAPIHYNGFNCHPSFNPTTLVADPTTAPLTQLTYQCTQVTLDAVTFNVQNAPLSLNALDVVLTPNDNSQVIRETIPLSNGSGTTTLNLTHGLIYSVSATTPNGYSLSFSPQPLTVSANAVETITLSSSTGSTSGRIIGYLPGWKTPPSAEALANAGYTHIMVSFGVFSTTTPGTITSAFDTVSKTYIQSLKQKGIKVLLSLGGASSSLPNTTVDFHQVLTGASSPDDFKQTFINSLQSLITEYQFDGFDIDIEQGLNGGGTFAQPVGDIAVLASIINTMHSQNPSLLISLTPQVANIAATSGFDATWGNYASLIMQTADSLSWVGIQLYNTGCAFGIDQFCYSPDPSSPDFSVAMAVDLLENWPATVSGQATGFQPYISQLLPSKVVIGYPAPNGSGTSDGAPVTPTSTIKRALQCLNNATVSSQSCGTYSPPRAYGLMGGVFNWEATYDENNQFKFATELKDCVINGICS